MEKNLIFGIILGVIVGLIVGFLISIVNANNQQISCPTINEKNCVNYVISSPDSQFSLHKTISERLTWDECKSGMMTVNNMCYIESYNPSLNLLQCACWNLS